jgi:hypothetical protein
VGFVAARGSTNSSVDSTTYTVTPTAALTSGNVWLLTTSHKEASTVAPSSGVSGRGLTWTLMTDGTNTAQIESSSDITGQETYIGIGTDSGAGDITVTFPATNQACIIHLTEWSGIDTSNPAVQVKTGRTTVNAATITITFTSAPTSSMTYGSMSTTFPQGFTRRLGGDL